MSLIFKALQRFEHPGDMPEATASEPAPKRNGVSFRKALFSPPVVIGTAAIIFLAGFAVSRFVDWLPGKMANLTPPVEASVAVADGAAASDDVPSKVVKIDVEPGSVDPSTTGVATAMSLLVHPPEEGTATARLDSVLPDGDKNSPPMENGDSLQSRAKAPTAVVAMNSEEKAGPSSPSEGALPANVLSLVRYDKVSLPRPLHSEVKEARPPVAASAGQSPQPEGNPLHKLRAAQANRHLKISQLTNSIHAAIQDGDMPLTDKLFSRLTRMKGADNAFVQKLKAYSLIQQNRLEEARALLSDVLAKRADDLEAGLNMAVVEMKSGQVDSARQRLLHLRGLYPENENITNYLRRLSSS